MIGREKAVVPRNTPSITTFSRYVGNKLATGPRTDASSATIMSRRCSPPYSQNNRGIGQLVVSCCSSNNRELSSSSFVTNAHPHQAKPANSDTGDLRPIVPGRDPGPVGLLYYTDTSLLRLRTPFITILLVVCDRIPRESGER